MKRGRKKGGKFINGKYIAPSKIVKKDADYSQVEIIMRAIHQERIKLIDHIRNVILPELERKL